ncbi:unnamed protein product [Caenorhabditis bovis]|uniref:Uncharacterized protein n=1 Tax=Caenorhabditis bovis TaxID=2654633 RepID=A0A8S1EAC5_9PELO|nr:unnamed protein product [Caenorhabditis bovis]
MGAVVFEAYNKVGDNSAVNMLPVLASELKESKDMTMFDSSGDVNIQKILPSTRQIDPDDIDFIWKSLPDNYVTSFNDDIMHTHRGLFHYPPNAFEMGFKEKPTRHYFRPFYVYIYKKLKDVARKCAYGRLLADMFIEPWVRFENIFAEIPHFSLNFISSLTHDDPNSLNLLDNDLHRKLSILNDNQRLNSTFLVIMGDHGNRIHAMSRYSFAGRAEERSPMLAIIPPSSFIEKFPNKMLNLYSNAQRFVSNYDLHETLLEILNLPSNPSTAREPIHQENLTSTFNSYILSQYLTCFDQNSAKCDAYDDLVMPNNYVQIGTRVKVSDNEVKRRKKKASEVSNN